MTDHPVPTPSPRRPRSPKTPLVATLALAATFGSAAAVGAAFPAPAAAQSPAMADRASEAPADVVLREGRPEDVGMSSAILESGVRLYEEAVERGDLVGAVLLVARNGTIVLHEAVGWRDQAERTPMEPSTMFRMASNTKAVVATAIGVLADADSIDADDLVRDYIPSFDNYRSGFISVHHLLTHTSGFRIGSLFLYPLLEPSPDRPDAPNLRLEAARFGEVGAEVLPGTSYSYSNPGYNTLGALVEIVSGRPLDTFIDERIYEPLGMVDSYHHEVAEKLDGKLDRMSVVYYDREGEDGPWTPGWSPGDPPQLPFVRASGGMISTTRDYAVFCQMFLNGGVYDGQRILEEETVEAMTSPQTDRIGGPDENPAHYGYGWQVRADGSFSHTGSDGTAAWIDPNTGVIGLVFTQTPGGENPRDRFRELVELSILE